MTKRQQSRSRLRKLDRTSGLRTGIRLLRGLAILTVLARGALLYMMHGVPIITSSMARKLDDTTAVVPAHSGARQAPETLPLQVSGWRSLCDLLENDGRIVAHSIQYRTSCESASTGNKLGQLYMTELLATRLGVPFLPLNCTDNGKETETILARLPFRRTFSTSAEKASTRESSWQGICSDCRSNFPHVCTNGLGRMTSSIQRDLRHVVEGWLHQPANTNEPRSTFDDFAIHIRCGDMLNRIDSKLFKGKYGFSPYSVYDRVIEEHSDIQSIGIITKYLSNRTCSPKECPFVETCNTIVQDAQVYLKSKYPSVAVSVRNDLNESLTKTYARMILAKVILCDSSTFCLFPVIASKGIGYITQSDELYPWVSHMESEKSVPGVRVLPRARFLSVREIAENGMGASAIVSWRRVTD